MRSTKRFVTRWGRVMAVPTVTAHAPASNAATASSGVQMRPSATRFQGCHHRQEDDAHRRQGDVPHGERGPHGMDGIVVPSPIAHDGLGDREYPGGHTAGTIIVVFPVTPDAFANRKALKVTIQPYDQPVPLVLTK